MAFAAMTAAPAYGQDAAAPSGSTDNASDASAASEAAPAKGRMRRVTVERYAVDVAAYAGRAAAEDLAAAIRKHFDDVYVEKLEYSDGFRYRVTTGEFKKDGGAKARIKALEELGFDTRGMTVRRFTFEQLESGKVVQLPPIIKQPQEREGNGRFNFELFGTPINIGGELEYRPSYLNNFNLLSNSIRDENGELIRKANADTFRMRNSLQLEGLWIPSKKVAVFAQGRFNWNVRLSNRSAREEIINIEGIDVPIQVGGCGDPPRYPASCDTNEVSFVRGQSWIYVHDLWDVPAGLQAGRQRFRDTREWWWDANLDALQLHLYGTDFLRVELGVAREVAQLSPDDADIDPEEDGILRFLGHATWRWAPRHKIETYALYQDDTTGLANGDFNGIPGFGTVDPALRDEIDRDMLWVGGRASGRYKVSDDHKIYYWLDGAISKGKETTIDYGACPDDDPNCECDLLPEGCAIRPPKNDVYKRDVFGWGLDVGFTWDTKWRFEPRFTFGYAIGSGDGNPDQDAVETPDGNFRYPGTDGSFRQTGLQDNNGKFSGVNRFHYYGELFRPELSNMHIGTVSLGFPIFESSSVELLWHIYEQVNEAGYLTDADIGPSPNGRDRRLGQEFDLSLGIEEWEWLEIEITAAVFRAGEAFSRPDPRNNREGEIASFFEFKFEYNF